MKAARQRPAGEVSSEAGEVLARLLLEAAQDPKLRAQILFVLNLPSSQRESLVNSAVEEMKLRGEPAEFRAAFAVLATEAGARNGPDRNGASLGPVTWLLGARAPRRCTA